MQGKIRKYYNLLYNNIEKKNFKMNLVNKIIPIAQLQFPIPSPRMFLHFQFPAARSIRIRKRVSTYTYIYKAAPRRAASRAREFAAHANNPLVESF